jgi:molybdenum cofactor synthesis domain-containing protein
VNAFVLTVSGSVARGEAEDRAGEALRHALAQAGFEASGLAVPDDRDTIVAALREGLAAADVILTVGGSGLTVDDVTPEATRAVLDREVPGIAEALRAESVRRTPMGMLSRGTAGVAGQTLIVNLPGSAKAVAELWDVLAPVLRHAVELAQSGGGSRHLHG